MKQVLGIQDNGTKWKAPGMAELVLSQKEQILIQLLGIWYLCGLKKYTVKVQKTQQK